MTVSNSSAKSSVSGLLLREIQHGATVQSLLDSVFDLWYYPSLFLDMSHNIDCYSRYSSEYDPWGALFENGVLSHNHLDEPIGEVLSKRRSGNKKDRIVLFSVDEQRYICALVSHGSSPLGFLLIHCSRSKSDDDAIEICSGVSDAIGFLIQKDPSIQVSDYDYTRDYIARELLMFDERMGNAAPNAGSAEYSASPLWPKIKPNYRIAAISVEDNENSNLKAVDKEIYRDYPNSYSLIKSSTLYIFFYNLGDKDEKNEDELRKGLTKASENNSVTIALSSMFEDLNRRQVFRRQAVDLSRMCSSNPGVAKVIYADDYYPELVIYASKKRIGDETLMLSEFAYLKDYDNANGTEYLKTLCWYLRCCGIIRNAASKLHLEPKSLRYRINKICGILNRSREELLSDNAMFLSAIASCPENSD